MTTGCAPPTHADTLLLILLERHDEISLYAGVLGIETASSNQYGGRERKGGRCAVQCGSGVRIAIHRKIKETHPMVDDRASKSEPENRSRRKWVLWVLAMVHNRVK